MGTTPGNKATATAVKLITSTLDRDELADILFNWNESGLSADGENIIQHVGRDRQFSRGSEGGKARIGKKEFIAWLLSDGPFDETVYGNAIRLDREWRQRIEAARMASGLYQNKDHMEIFLARDIGTKTIL